MQTLPQLRPEDVGRPFESPSAAGFKAARDYDLPDAALTDRRRQEARAGVRWRQSGHSAIRLIFSRPVHMKPSRPTPMP